MLLAPNRPNRRYLARALSLPYSRIYIPIVQIVRTSSSRPSSVGNPNEQQINKPPRAARGKAFSLIISLSSSRLAAKSQKQNGKENRELPLGKYSHDKGRAEL